MSEQRKSSADLCREHGWGVGTILEGEECGRVERIRITAIGETKILAVDEHDWEAAWTLDYREWRAVEP